jgi:hypothetical protein
MLTKEDILALAWEYSEGSGKRYTFTEDSLLEMMWVALSRLDHSPRTQDSAQPQQTAPQGYILLPKQCPSWLEDAYDDQCEKDKWNGDGLYLPAYDAMVKALEGCQEDFLKDG